MKIRILEESGHQWAICGLCLSYQELPDDLDEFISQRKMELAQRLAAKDGGHNKFLESVSVWLDIDAPVYFWQEFDTYRTGMTKQSESKMHTLMKRELTKDDFEGGVNSAALSYVNHFIREKQFNDALGALPMSFLQRRVIATNYKALRTICNQRRGHKLTQWKQFVDHMEAELMWPWAVMQHKEADND